jgi:hypothetical protein
MLARLCSTWSPGCVRGIAMSEATWQGYVRADGRIGIRNVVLVVYTVLWPKASRIRM